MPRFFIFLFSFSITVANAQNISRPEKFEQLNTQLPTPNAFRSSSGAPCSAYWRQKTDYIITAELNDETHRIFGVETVIYANNSPDVLKYLWLQLDQNILAKGNLTKLSDTDRIRDTL